MQSERKVSGDGGDFEWGNSTDNEHGYVSIKLYLSHCMIAHITLIGSFLFIVLGGYGLAYTPMQFLNSFLNRPQIRDAEDYTLTKLILRVENEKLVDETKKLIEMKKDLDKTVGFVAQRGKRFALNREVNKLKKQFLEHEEVMESFNEEKNIQESNPLIHLTYLIGGVVGFIASFMIIFHV